MANVAVIGTGMMGPGIAACLALAGHTVCLFGRSPASLERGLVATRDAMDLLQREGLAAPSQTEHLRGTTVLAQAVDDADFVFESIAENLEQKHALFADLDQLAPPHAIF